MTKKQSNMVSCELQTQRLYSENSTILVMGSF